MKVPDKIYLNSDATTDVVYPPGEDDSKIEYIRKDALIEWAKDEIMPGNSAEGKGWNWALQTIIDKLNSM